MLASATVETFAPHVGTTFTLEHPQLGALALELVSAQALPGLPAEVAASERLRAIPFSLVFRGPAAPILAQHIYQLEHDRLGRLDLFLVPIAADPGGVSYEAAFA